MKFKGAIFDMDGVLFDTERLYQETWQEIAAERSVQLADDFLTAISGTNGCRMKQVIKAYYHVSDGTSIMEKCMSRMKHKLEDHVPVKKGVYKILEYFHEHNIRLAVASSSSEAQIKSNLSKNGIRAGHSAGCFTIMIPDLIEPSPEIIPLCSEIFSDFFQVLEHIGEIL